MDLLSPFISTLNLCIAPLNQQIIHLKYVQFIYSSKSVRIKNSGDV